MTEQLTFSLSKKAIAVLISTVIISFLVIHLNRGHLGVWETGKILTNPQLLAGPSLVLHSFHCMTFIQASSSGAQRKRPLTLESPPPEP